MSYQKLILLGNIGNDPEIKNLDNGVTIANLSIATSESYKDKKGEKVTETEWHRCTAFGKTAEIIEKYVKKGDKLLIEGKLKTRSWEKDGEKKYATDVIIQNMTMVGSKQQSNSTQPVAVGTDEEDDDLGLPF